MVNRLYSLIWCESVSQSLFSRESANQKQSVVPIHNIGKIWQCLTWCAHFKVSWLSLKLIKIKLNYIWFFLYKTLWEQPDLMWCLHIFISGIFDRFAFKFFRCVYMSHVIVSSNICHIGKVSSTWCQALYNFPKEIYK